MQMRGVSMTTVSNYYLVVIRVFLFTDTAFILFRCTSLVMHVSAASASIEVVSRQILGTL